MGDCIMIKNILLSAVAFLALTGCGDSHGPAGTQLQGVAIDDLIVNGVVTAYDANDRSHILANGRTGADDGFYTLSVSHDGVVIVEVTCDAESRLLNPENGEKRVCRDVTLHTAAEVKPGSDPVVVNATPLSEATVARMLALGVSPENLEKAKEEVKTLFGVDPLADDPRKGSYAKVLDAFGDVAAQSGKSVMEVTAEVAEDLKDGDAGDLPVMTRLAQAMKEQNLTNNLAENNGTFSPEALGFNADELIGKRFYLVGDADFGTVDFNQTHMSWQSLLNPADSDTAPYTVENGKIMIDDEEEVVRKIKAPGFSVVTLLPDGEEDWLFSSEAAAKAKIFAKGAGFEEMVSDATDDARSSLPGFELTGMKATIKENHLVFVVKAKGDIKAALETAEGPVGYYNQLHLTINDAVTLILDKEGVYFFKRDGTAIQGASVKELSDGVVIRLPVGVLEHIGEIAGVRIETGAYPEAEDADEKIYDRIETFVIQKSLPVTEELVAGKTFYAVTVEDGEPAYYRYTLDATNNITVSSMDPEPESEQGTYRIEDGKLVATVGDQTYTMTLLAQNDAGLIFMIYDGEGKSFEVWFFDKPADFPDMGLR